MVYDGTMNTTTDITANLMDYSDETHVFGIIHLRRDLDGNGQVVGELDGAGGRTIHREGLTKEGAIAWLQGAFEDGVKPGVFEIVATPRPRWERIGA